VFGPGATLSAVQGHIRRAYRLVSSFIGGDPRAGFRSVRNLPRFVRTLAEYRARSSGGPFPLAAGEFYPVLLDFDASAGEASGHYFFQDLWAARKIFARRPERHIDIGSRIDGFVAHLLTFMPVTAIDVRPLTSSVPGLEFVRADATNLDGFSDQSVDSVSSLHAVEHFGLGRYGDRVDPDGWRKALLALQRVLRPGGRLYLSVPVGRERLCFNAHRIFSPTRVLDTVADLGLVSFAGVDDSGRFRDRVKPEELADQEYACGLFEFTR
jgi:SAM-dependent methyltransferase